MVGADTGTHSVKLLHLSKGVLQKARHSRYPQWPAPSENQVATVLQHVVTEMGCRGERVWGSVGGTSIIAHVANFPRMSPEDLRGAVSLEAEEFMSRKWAEVDFDFDILQTLPDGQVRVLFVAAPRELSDERLQYFKACGLYCVGMTIDSLALVTAFQHAAQRPQRRSVLLLNIGASNTNIVLLTDGQLSVLRDVSFGGNDLTETIAEGLAVPFEDAEKTKLAAAPNADIRDPVERAMEPLHDQIARTIGYQTRRSERVGDMAIYVSGGGGLAPGVTDSLSARFGAPVEFFDPFANVEVKCALPGEVALRSAYSVAMGNALLGEQLQ